MLFPWMSTINMLVCTRLQCSAQQLSTVSLKSFKRSGDNVNLLFVIKYSLGTVQLIWFVISTGPFLYSKGIERAAVCDRAQSFQLVLQRNNVIYRHNWKTILA